MQPETADWGRTRQETIGYGRAGLDAARRGWTRAERPDVAENWTGQDRAGRSRLGLDRAGLSKIGRDKAG